MAADGFRNVFATFCAAACIVAFGACSSERGILGPADETPEAVRLIDAANEDLQKIKVLYENNEGKRLEIVDALKANDVPEVRRLADEVVQLINEGTNFGNSAIEKIREARDLNIHKDFDEYLRLKEEALMLQLEAFGNYHNAARTLRDNFDPNDAAARDRVKANFTERTEKYRDLMEQARSLSSQANELYKETVRRK